MKRLEMSITASYEQFYSKVINELAIVNITKISKYITISPEKINSWHLNPNSVCREEFCSNCNFLIQPVLF